LPRYPRRRHLEGLDDSWEYTTEDFDRVLGLATEERYMEQQSDAGGKYVHVDPDFEIKASKLAHPDFPRTKSRWEAEYFSEICSLACVEAADRGLDYIWMDNLCIDQSDPEDVAEQVPLMADYFKGAEVCVVVSEMLRRRMAHRINRLGADVLNAEYGPPWDWPYKSGSGHSDERYREIQEEVQRYSGVRWEDVERALGEEELSRYRVPALQGIHPVSSPCFSTIIEYKPSPCVREITALKNHCFCLLNSCIFQSSMRNRLDVHY
jgi:hypothetical protein